VRPTVIFFLICMYYRWFWPQRVLGVSLEMSGSAEGSLHTFEIVLMACGIAGVVSPYNWIGSHNLDPQLLYCVET
jgi:hypothetical protein